MLIRVNLFYLCTKKSAERNPFHPLDTCTLENNPPILIHVNPFHPCTINHSANPICVNPFHLCTKNLSPNLICVHLFNLGTKTYPRTAPGQGTAPKSGPSLLNHHGFTLRPYPRNR